MTDFTTRLVLVMAVLAVVAVVVVVLRVRARVPYRRVGKVDLSPGVYLLTSDTCLQCGPARDVMLERLGEGGFVEISWERDRRRFEALPADVVPAVVLVGASGRATMWPGQPAAVFSELGA